MSVHHRADVYVSKPARCPASCSNAFRDTLVDGVTVLHTITAHADGVDFQVVAHNPGERASLAHWAQPCMRVDAFTGRGRQDAIATIPAYVRQCFLFVVKRFERDFPEQVAKRAARPVAR